MKQRCDRLDKAIREGRLLRRAWVDGNRACLLGTLAPECLPERASEACPPSVAPLWFAQLMPWIDDSTSDEGWLALMKRFAAAARQWSRLTPAQWEQIRVDWLCDDVLPTGLPLVDRVRRALRGDGSLERAAADAVRGAEKARLAGEWVLSHRLCVAGYAPWPYRAVVFVRRETVDCLVKALLDRIQA